ncbi:TetR/AcrR family transcriptional regulator [Ulvibacter litoralis]|uniref:DNA-binding transcriptional regulator, AcrR family n=1 Tax=Ulvibacter litoralis TaxID=227084 RepID=A0A1G7DPP2_9FLAO|nr:TetR/AcrR family transcriptional regulator [Ulvibacter litoralis]GHC42795.1 TetR family transcriptional regulator [Ulvibacter litoralis]SDE53126.1 DNA-binding transcriptional regulator, AcrR family [Ulvibacter litoralis]
MRDKIILNASKLFLSIGFKSVTMDDIAQEMGISKKTIYSHFSNKTELVKESTLCVFNEISCGINTITELHKNPIEELYEIKKFVLMHLKGEKTSPQYQLQKYYPEIYSELKDKQYEAMHACTVSNLQRGVALGLYRKNLDIEFVSRIYFMGVSGIKDEKLFPSENFSKAALIEEFLEYHIRGIITAEGLKTLHKFTNENQSISNQSNA